MKRRVKNNKKSHSNLSTESGGSAKYHLLTKHYALVFDICSSSEILENLQHEDKIGEWKDFCDSLYRFLLDKSENNEKFTIYKFIGDGFILLFDHLRTDDMLNICKQIFIEVNEKLKALIKNELTIRPKRIGITIGIALGDLTQFKISENIEYVGKAINVASRLQSLLKGKKHINKLLVSPSVKEKLSLKYKSILFKKRSRRLRNLFGGSSVYCYEIDLHNDLELFLK